MRNGIDIPFVEWEVVSRGAFDTGRDSVAVVASPVTQRPLTQRPAPGLLIEVDSVK